VITAAILLFVLELPHAPFLRWLDARTYSHRFEDDHFPGPSTGSD
jgi:hypothetical protein